MVNNCKHCGTPLLLQPTKTTADRLKKQYYFTHIFFCPNCKRIYHNEKFKVINNNYTLFASPNRSLDNIEVEIWTDGACSNNGKPNAKASWAFVSGEHEEAGLVDGKQTNNRGEALAIFHGLSWAAGKGFKNIRLHSDSQITLHGVIKHPEMVKENRDIFQKIHDLVVHNKLKIDYIKVAGHAGDTNNERADQLATQLVGLPSSSS